MHRDETTQNSSDSAYRVTVTFDPHPPNFQDAN